MLGRSARSRFFVACAVGGVVATVVFAWVVLGGHADLLAPETFGGFYDAQARSLLHGHWDVPANALSFERFKVGGRFFTYFGPWPALLRMPVLAFTREFDGRLSRVSMLVAFVVLLVFAARLAWQARTLVRGDGPPTRATLIAAGGFVFVAGCGSTALFLASRAWVYHEANLWGIAWSLASFSFLIAYLVSPRGRDLVFACVTATLALLSRPSVGAGPVIVLGALLAIGITQRATTWWRHHRQELDAGSNSRAWPARWLGVGDTAANQPIWPVAAALAIPIALYAYVNYSKFGTLFSLPYDKQDLLLRTPQRQAALAANHGSLFGLKFAPASLFGFDYVPTNVLQYLRPDAIRFDRLFPWVTSATPHLVGHVPFDTLSPSASIPAVSTLLVVLAVLGIIAAIRAPRPDTRTPIGAGTAGNATGAVLRAPILGATLATLGTVFVGVLAQRYEGDFVPLLVIAGAAGLFWLPALLAHRGRVARRLVAGALVALAAWSCWATFALTLRYQRTDSPFQSEATRAEFVASQLDVADALGLGSPSDVQRGPTLPHTPRRGPLETTAPLGRFFVVGDCAGLYLSNGMEWQPVEGTATGTHRWRVTFGPPRPGTRMPLWSTNLAPPRFNNLLWARWIDDRHIRVEYEWTGLPNTVAAGTSSLRVQPGRTYDLDVRLDPVEHAIEVKYRKELLFRGFPAAFDAAIPSTLGSQNSSRQDPTTFTGTIRNLPPNTPNCDRLIVGHRL